MSTPRKSRIAVADMTVIALVAVMILVGKTVLRVPIHLSGHAGVLWIAALVIGRGVVRRPGAATFMALIGGLLVAMMQPSDGGFFFTVAKYLAAGIVLDALTPLLGGRLDRLVPAIVAGAAAHAGKVAVDLVQGIAAGVPGSVLALGLTADLALHIAFGALGGLLGALVLRVLARARIPQMAGLTDEGGAR
jgi:ABC-type thiamin/hydroxymethylpyrimidine transport system permease subunit